MNTILIIYVADYNYYMLMRFREFLAEDTGPLQGLSVGTWGSINYNGPEFLDRGVRSKYGSQAGNAPFVKKKKRRKFAKYKKSS